jgi:hypothetical protein
MKKQDFLRVCRELRDMGYAELVMLCDNDQGFRAGSAYLRTEMGDELIALVGECYAPA